MHGGATATAVRRRMRAAVWADPATTIGEAARLLGDEDSCVLVRLHDGTGIATDHDFRTALAHRSVSRDTALGDICSAPVVTVNEHADAPTALLEMLEHGIHHVVVTTDTGDPVGVVRFVDLASDQVRDPVLVRRQVLQAQTLEDLRQATAHLDDMVVETASSGVPALRVSGVLSAVRDLVLQRVAALTPTSTPSRGVSWLVLGSAARREALPRSDVDTALAWPVSLDDQASRLRDDAEQVLEGLRRTGLATCPDGANATEALFSRSDADWLQATRRWTSHPESTGALLLASIVADSRALTNVELGSALMRSMLDAARDRLFLTALLDFSLAAKPARRALHGFAVERSGAHRGQLDLKRGGLWPVVLLGRWLALATGDPNGSTVDRIRRGSESGLLSAGEADDLVAAFELVFQLRLDQELAVIGSGRPPDSHLDPETLDPLRRRFVRDSFDAVSRIQASIRKAWSSRELP
jgi:CBS domain-containing protein